MIDAYKVAREVGMGGRINTIMQTCIFALSGILPRDEAIASIKTAIEKTYGKRGPVLVQQNFKAVDSAIENMVQVELPSEATATRRRPPVVSDEAPEFVQTVTSVMMPMRPSEPSTISRRSGPADEAGKVGSSRDPAGVSMLPPANICSMRP